MVITKLNFNYFLALSVLGSMLSLWFVAPLPNMFFMLLFHSSSGLFWINTIVVFLVIVGIAIIWNKKGNLIPTELKPDAETRFRIGNVAMVLANLFVVMSLLVSVLGFLFVEGFGVVIGMLVAGALLLTVPLNIVGIVCIETSRQKSSKVSM